MTEPNYVILSEILSEEPYKGYIVETYLKNLIDFDSIGIFYSNKGQVAKNISKKILSAFLNTPLSSIIEDVRKTDIPKSPELSYMPHDF